MKPLRVYLVHSNRLAEKVIRDQYGSFCYEVPEFEIVGRKVFRRHNTFLFPAGELDCDVVIHEDSSIFGKYLNATVPIGFRVVDSTLSESHYHNRHNQAKLADFTMLDFDQPSRFGDVDGPVFQAGYGVNERHFRDMKLERDIDVGFVCHVQYSPERAELARWVKKFCEDSGYSVFVGSRGGDDYVEMMNRCKIVVNANRNPMTRAHRTFDAMACGACLLSTPIPKVIGENFIPGIHYAQFRDYQPTAWEHEAEPIVNVPDLADTIDNLIMTGEWREIAENGQRYVLNNFTWGHRAKTLRQSLGKVLNE